MEASIFDDSSFVLSSTLSVDCSFVLVFSILLSSFSVSFSIGFSIDSFSTTSLFSVCDFSGSLSSAFSIVGSCKLLDLFKRADSSLFCWVVVSLLGSVIGLFSFSSLSSLLEVSVLSDCFTVSDTSSFWFNEELLSLIDVLSFEVSSFSFLLHSVFISSLLSSISWFLLSSLFFSLLSFSSLSISLLSSILSSSFSLFSDTSFSLLSGSSIFLFSSLISCLLSSIVSPSCLFSWLLLSTSSLSCFS